MTLVHKRIAELPKGGSTITVDSELSDTSKNPVQNKKVKQALDEKQTKLESGQNVKTINGQSILGSGNIQIESGGGNSYTKQESDAKYQPKGNYQPAGDYATEQQLEDKVDKETGKGLSTNDYTNEDKTKVAAALTEHQDISGKADKTSLQAEVARATNAEENLRQLYENLSQSQPIPVTQLPATGEAGKIYRLAGTTSYADYMYSENDLTTPIKMAEYNNAIDDVSTDGSDNLIKSGGVYKLKGNLYKVHGVLKGDGSVGATSVANLYCTDFLPINGNSDIVVDSFQNTQSAIYPLCFYDNDKKFLTAYTSQTEYTSRRTVEKENIPSGARFIRVCGNITSNPSVISGIDFDSIIGYISDVSAAQKSLNSVAENYISTKSFTDNNSLNILIDELYIKDLSNLNEAVIFVYNNYQQDGKYWNGILVREKNGSSYISHNVIAMTDTANNEEKKIIVTDNGGIIYTTASIPYGTAASYTVNLRSIVTDKFANPTISVKMADDSINEDSDSLIKSRAVYKGIKPMLDVLTYFKLIPNERIEEGRFVWNNGQIIENQNASTVIYAVTGGQEYKVSGLMPSGYSLWFINWFDENGDFISQEYLSPSTQQDNYTDVPVTAPPTAAYLYIDSAKATVSTISVKELAYIKPAQERNYISKVTVVEPNSVGGYIDVRSEYDVDNDIIIRLSRKDNDNISPSWAWIGSKALSDGELAVNENLFHRLDDSTSPIIISEYAPWHLFSQHGYCIPLITASHSLTDADLNTQWTDDKGRAFTIGKYSTNQIWLLPVVSGPDSYGVYTRSWKNPNREEPIGSISRNGVSILVTSQTFTQLKPIQEHYDLHIIIDGSEYTESGTYYGNEVKISEILRCYNPFTVQTWFPTPVGNTVMADIIQSYQIVGLSVRYDTALNIHEPLKFDSYSPNQAQHFMPYSSTSYKKTEGYNVYTFVPKTKLVVNGKNADVPHISETSADSIPVVRNTTCLYDIDKISERQISYFFNQTTNEYLAGFASGLSLTRGMTKDTIRNTLIGTGEIALNMSYPNYNKMYVKAVNSEHFTNNILPAGFTGLFSSYYVYYKPDSNRQVYWYKDGNNYVIYIHCQTTYNGFIQLPAFMDGLSVEVIEKTDGVSLVTDILENGKLYITTDNSNNNYLVIKTK